MLLRRWPSKQGKVQLAAVCLTAGVLVTILAAWKIRDHPGLAVHGAVQAITMPSPQKVGVDDLPLSGWVQDGRLWIMATGNSLVTAAPPYKLFTPVHAGEAAQSAISGGGMSMSPDGKWCMDATAGSLEGFNDAQEAWSLTDSRVVSRAFPLSGLPQQNWWKRDGSGFYSLIWTGNSELVFTPISPNQDKHGELTHPIKINGLNFQGIGSVLAGEFPDGKLLLYSCTTLVASIYTNAAGTQFINDVSPVTTWTISPNGKQKVQEANWNPFPAQRSSIFSDQARRQWEEMSLSPDGKRLAWICDVQRTPWLTSFIHDKIGIGSSPHPAHTAEVYITDLQGRHDRSVAWVPGNPPQFGQPLQQVMWLPNGRSVSVLYKNKLYIIPAGP